MSITNPGFETKAAGAAPEGRPLGWTIVEAATELEFAQFSNSGALGDEGEPRDTFEEGWPDFTQTLIGGLVGSNSEMALFDVGASPQFFEDFETLWADPAGSFEISSIEFAEFTGLDWEAFETGWGAVLYTFTSGDLTFAAYDTTPESYEDYEEDWSLNQNSYVATGTPIVWTLALFTIPSGTNAFDGFESVKLDQVVVSSDPSTERLTVTSHGFAAAARVYLYALDDNESVLPAPLSDEHPYFVLSPATHDFQLEQQIGSGTINLTDEGFGVSYVKADPVYYWTYELTGI